MSAYKLLSKFTKLNKAEKGNEAQPTATTLSDKIDHGDRNVLSRKRKRGESIEAPNATDQSQHIVSDAQQQRGLNSSSRVNLRVPIADFEPLPDDACRQVLRKQKVKITRLWDEKVTSSHGVLSDSTERLSKRKSSAVNPAGDSKPKRSRTDVHVQPLMSFSQLCTQYNLPTTLLVNLDALGFSRPTEVQLGSLPLLLHGKSTDADEGLCSTVNAPVHKRLSQPACDLLSVAPTGSGKTLAFLLPMISSLMRQRRRATQEQGRDAGEKQIHGPSAIILAPTKELVRQIVNEGRKLTIKTGIRISAVQKSTRLPGDASTIGADSLIHDADGHDDEQSPVTKSHILVSTPLALVHAAVRSNQREPDLSTVTNLVLDEADVLLDPLFREDTMRVWDACSHDNLRTSLWSATVGSNIEELSLQKLRARSLATDHACPFYRLVVGLKDSSIPNIRHRLIYAATEQGKLMGIRQLLHTPEAAATGEAKVRPPFLIFTQTIPRAVALHAELLYDIPPEAGSTSRIAVLHSDLSDTARERVMASLRRGDLWVLITTDLLSRGVDFRGINGVINYDLPHSSAAYVHRVGRTGRAGREGGVAITFYGKDDLPYVKNVANVIAASERHKGLAEGAASSRQWLLDSLPKVSKKDKQSLKRRGVEARRTRRLKGEASLSRPTKTTISTRSGYERRLGHRRRAAIEYAKRSGEQNSTYGVDVEAHDEFAGFGD